LLRRNNQKRAAANLFRRICALAVLFVAGGGALAYFWFAQSKPAKVAHVEISTVGRSAEGVFRPTSAQWAALSIEPVKQMAFPTEHLCVGKIGVNESNSTLIFSPYSGRVTKLLVKVGDAVTRGQPLLLLEASDMVQAQNDFVAAVTNLNKGRSQLNLAQTIEKRTKELQQAKAVPLKEWEQAQAALLAAQNDLRAAETALEAARNRLRLIGRSEEEIATLQDKGVIGAEITINAPLDGTIVQRKVGPGQYISSAASDPVFVVGDLRTIWLLAYVREIDAPKAKLGQTLSFRVLALPEREFTAKISYIAPTLEPSSRRLRIRATIENPEGVLKPEMSATVKIQTGETDLLPAVPREAIVGEAPDARVWVVRDDKVLESRRIQLGLEHGATVQVVDGLSAGERVVTTGRSMVDRAATGS